MKIKKKRPLPPQIHHEEPLAVRVVPFPVPLREALQRELKRRGWTMRQMMHHVEETRLDKTVQELIKIGFPYAKPGDARKAAKIRIPKSVLWRLQLAMKHTGLPPVALLYLLLSAELRD